MSSFGGNIYTLSLCPAIDTTLYLEEIGLDRELPVHREHSEAGGKGANTAAALAVQGTQACSCICWTMPGCAVSPSRCRGASGKISRWKHHRASTV